MFAAAVSAFAHGTSGIIEIEVIDARVDAQLGVTFGKEHRAYKSLARVLRKPSRKARGLADDMTKLIAVVRACAGPLAHDPVLRPALSAPEADADEYLADAPGDVRIALGKLERAKDRASVGAALDAAAAAHAEGLARRDAGDEIGMLTNFRTAGAKLARAGSLLQSLLAKQVRRAPPGQPLAKGPKGTIDTYAGIGVAGFKGDGGSALNASFYFPSDVATDPSSGLVYICDFNNHRVRRIDADGKVRTVAGSGELGDTEGPALEAKLHHPASLSFHPQTGELWIAGWHVHRIIRLLSATNEIEHYAGGVRGNAGDEGPVTAAELNYPSCVTFDSAGGWYVADQDNQRVRYVDAGGTIHALAGTGTAGFAGDDGPALLAELSNPSGDVDAPAGRCALDPTEKFLYVADTANHRVRRVDLATKEITTFAGNGVAGDDGDGGAATSAMLHTPVDVDCDAAGNVYVCDRETFVVRKIDAATDVITTFAGVPGNDGYSGDGKSAALARLDRPSGIYMDRVRGRLYIADTGNNVIRVVWE
jgi:DNA-binding beta-propeller fold protein YncE